MSPEIPITIASHQVRNLRKLARYLLSNKLKGKFDMGIFAEPGRSDETNCGSVGCAVGHGPYAGIRKKSGEYWEDYVARVFGIPMSIWSDEVVAAIPNPAFDYLFHEAWSQEDNTPQGAAGRILKLLEFNRL